LVVIQFTASVALIASTLIVYRQLDFMMNREIGMDIDQVLVVERPGISPRDRSEFNSSVDVFRNELKKSSSVAGVTTSVTIPGKEREYKAIVKKYGAGDDELVSLRFNSMDYNFIDVFKMKIISGRAFSEDFTTDRDTAVIISESASRLLGFKYVEDAVGQTLAIPGFRWNPIVVGVVNDYHQESLKKPLDPSIFYCNPYGGEFYSMRIQTSDLPGTIDHIRQSWTKAFPGNPMDYFFLDDYFNKQYDNEKKFGRLFSVFASLAVIVGCLGLFGLSAYTASQRTKEIGVRKAMGSSEGGIFFLLSKEYMKLIIVAIIIAVPLVWITMESWITSFPYQTTISPMEFIVAGLSVLIVSLSTVSFQTLKAARTNPVDSLRQE
jgi:putative ABC transport system permease protein